MMMRKRTNRCRNTVWDISVISRNKNGETLCGDQCALEWDDNDATVILSDGLGSGVKANILSTLTTTMLTTMLKGNVPIDECVTTVAETLPMVQGAQARLCDLYDPADGRHPRAPDPV